jgi:hypothetical protein
MGFGFSAFTLISKNGSHRLAPRLVLAKMIRCSRERTSHRSGWRVDGHESAAGRQQFDSAERRRLGHDGESQRPGGEGTGQLMAGDEAALAEVDKWIQGNNAFAAQGAGESKEALNRRIRALDPVRKDYEDFLRRYPDFARGHLAYGSFLNDIGEEEGRGSNTKKPRNSTRKIRRRGTNSPITAANTARHQRLRGLRQSHRIESSGAGVLPESRHDGLSFPQGRAGVLRHQRGAGFRQGARAVSQGHAVGSAKFSCSRPITRKAITASARSAPTTRSGRGRTRSKSPTTTTSAKAFISIWRESKWPPAVLPKPARI